MTQNCPVVKVGGRAYLVPRNYGGHLDCDQATCTQLEKCRGGTQEITHCPDTRNRDKQWSSFAGGPMKRVHHRGTHVLCECCKVG